MAILVFAVDGLKLAETLQISPLTPEQREAIIQEMLILADTWASQKPLQFLKHE